MMLATAPRYYAQQQRLTALAVRQARRASSLPQLMQTVAVYQMASAALSIEQGVAALDEQGYSADGSTVAAATFTLDAATADVFDEIDNRTQFDRLVSSLVADAGRSAAGVFTASRREEYGHIRHLTTPSCQRCVVLAGRWYRWSTGFQRHPHCDCTMIPGPRSAAQFAPSPYDAYRNGQITDLTKAQVQAIEDGADISQVVNARRGMQVVNFAGRRLKVTTEGTTARGVAGKSLGSLEKRRGERYRRAAQMRLSPEAIYNVADDREHAIRLLRLHGYIT